MTTLINWTLTTNNDDLLCSSLFQKGGLCCSTTLLVSGHLIQLFCCFFINWQQVIILHHVYLKSVARVLQPISVNTECYQTNQSFDRSSLDVRFVYDLEFGLIMAHKFHKRTHSIRYAPAPFWFVNK